MICWKRYSEAPKPPTTRTFCDRVRDRVVSERALWVVYL